MIETSVAPGRLFSLALTLLLAWGAFAFGAEYSWAYAPLLVWAVATAVLGWLAGPHGTAVPRPLWWALSAVFVAAALQATPLPPRVVSTLSPASTAVPYDQLYAKATMREVSEQTDGPSARPLSIEPSRTRLGLAFLGAFIVLFAGCTRGLAAQGPHGIARAVMILGVIAALAELAQKASGSETIYGFWYPPKGGITESAPFINRNHTAGWLVMALCLSAGSFAGDLARAWRGVRPDWRHRVLWLGTPQASRTLLTALALLVMATAIVLTASRSGFVCLLLATVLLVGWAVRRQPTRSRRATGAAYFVFVLLMGAVWGGVDAVLQRFQHADVDLWGEGRARVWSDTLSIIRDFAWTGTGWNTYGIAMLHYQTVPRGDYFIEAHNDYLQFAAEGGLLLGLPALAALGLFVREVRRRFREGADDTRTYWLRAGATTGLVAIAVQESVEFTLQMPGAAALFVVLAAIAIHRPHQGTSGRGLGSVRVQGVP